MKLKLLRGFALSASLVGAMVSVAASADVDSGKGCQLQGTWFGVDSPETKHLTGWTVSVAGQSSNRGTNILEYPTFDPTLGQVLPATRVSALRGAWERTGGNTYAYTMTGIAVNDNQEAIWIGKLSGNIVLSADCNSETITAKLEVFLPAYGETPFDGAPVYVPVIQLPTHYGYRAYVDLAE